MNDQPIHYAVLRDLDQWNKDAKWAGLDLQPDGVLLLARIPGTSNGKPIVMSSEFVIKSSGLAIGDCKDLYIADTINHRIIAIDDLCNSRTLLGVGGAGSAPSQFHDPRGLLVVKDNLYVADGGNGRVQVFRLPSLELRATWEGLLEEPIALAADSQGRVYVLDSGLKCLLRFSAWGIPDDDYNAAMENHLNGHTPIALAIDGSDRVYVSDEGSNDVLRFDSTNKLLDSIQGDKPAHPRAMTCRGNWLYVADESTGTIWVFDCEAEVFLGTLPDYRGPVSAMAVDNSGALYIKPGLDETYHMLIANMACVPLGILTAGPFDAGVGVQWERVHADVDLPNDTDASLSVFTASDKSADPDWSKAETHAASLDTLLLDKDRRFLWLRVELQSDIHRRISPRLLQVHAETTAESYIDYLPAVYSRKDAPEHFLEHWLAGFRSQLGDLELELEEMPRRFDPLTAPEDHLKWLASWLALDPLPDLANSEFRDLLPTVHQLYELRGTPTGIRDFVELYTGVRPALFEAFRERHIWQLGYTSMLGFDTALAESLPDGMIIPGHTLADPSCQGLRGDYYSGIDFKALELTRTDRTIDFDWVTGAPDTSMPSDFFSVRWTGQILPRYSERYTFHVLSDDGMRLWVDGVLIIDQWIDQYPTEYSGTMELEAGRWYAIQLEYFENAGGATIKLFWSSRSQSKEIIPQSQLYSVRDDSAKFELQDNEQPMLVGQTVVGESGPLNKSDFGMPLFSEAAHLFTVIVPAGALPGKAQRETLQRVIEAEKPAHTDYHLCFVEPRMRVGFQARLGIDSIVASPLPPMDLSGATLGLDSYLGEEDGQTGRVGQRARLGQDTRIG